MNNNPNPKTSTSQCARIYKYLLEGKTIDPIIAKDLFRCGRLTARIDVLEIKRGFETIRGWIKYSGRNYRTYHLPELYLMEYHKIK